MPATSTGRGAQVIVDPGSDTARAIRGVYAPTYEGNAAKARGDRLAGTLAYADTSPDGTTATGGVATDPMMATNAAKLIDQSNVAVPHTGDTVQFLFKAIAIPAGAMGPNGLLRVSTLWSFTGSASKNVFVTFSNTSGGSGNIINQPITTSLSFNDMRLIRNGGSTVAQKFFPANTAPFGIANPTVGTLAVNTDAACFVNLLGTLTNAGESITLEGYTVELLRLG